MHKESKTDAITTFLGSDASIEGKIEFKGTIRLDGNVKGKICSKEGTVIIGEKAVINGDIDVGVAIIMGRINGSVAAKNGIEAYPPGIIEGDIRSPAVSMKAGVKFNGNCSMTPSAMSSAKTDIINMPSHPDGNAKK